VHEDDRGSAGLLLHDGGVGCGGLGAGNGRRGGGDEAGGEALDNTKVERAGTLLFRYEDAEALVKDDKLVVSHGVLCLLNSSIGGGLLLRVGSHECTFLFVIVHTRHGLRTRSRWRGVVWACVVCS
jgi:hypothetical protein